MFSEMSGIYLKLFFMGFFVTASCALLGNYLLLRRMSMVGDAISHSILPGIVVAFLISQARAGFFMFLGALLAGLFTTFLIEFIQDKSKIKQDSAISVTFSTLFALGVLLISVYADHIDLDAECVLYGEINDVVTRADFLFLGINFGPYPIVIMGFFYFLLLGVIRLFYKELLLSTFDKNLSVSIGLSPKLINYGLMIFLSLVVVSAFESVGAILVVAMLIIPSATAYLLAKRLFLMIVLSQIFALLSVLFGLWLALVIDCSGATGMVISSLIIFCIVWFYKLIFR